MCASNTMASSQPLQPYELHLAARFGDAGPRDEELSRTDEAWIKLYDDAAQVGLKGLILEHAIRPNVELPRSLSAKTARGGHDRRRPERQNDARTQHGLPACHARCIVSRLNRSPLTIFLQSYWRMSPGARDS